jgi:hypothetical protein
MKDTWIHFTEPVAVTETTDNAVKIVKPNGATEWLPKKKISWKKPNEFIGAVFSSIIVEKNLQSLCNQTELSNVFGEKIPPEKVKKTITIESLPLLWSETKIAKNLHYFRISEPSDGFWEMWKESKEEIKALNVKTYKDEKTNKFLVYDWSRTDSATQAEYDVQQQIYERKQEIRTEIELKHYVDSFISNIESSHDLNDRERNSLIDEAQSATDIDELYSIIQRESEDSEAMWADIENNSKHGIETEIRNRIKKEFGK